MFSSRLDFDLSQNRLSRLLAGLRAAGAGVLDLTESNPTRAGFSYPDTEILNSLAGPGSLIYSPEPAGSLVAREAIAAWYAARGLRVKADSMVLTTSTSESYAYILKLLADPGGEILVPRPSYPLFEYLAALESVRIVPYPLIYTGEWSIDFQALDHAASERARAVILVNPNNPTGSFLKQHELEKLIPFARSHGLAVVSDEVFADYSFSSGGHRVASLVEVKDVLTFCLSGLSKVSGLPQMKLGWMTVSGPAAPRREAMRRLEWIADTYLSVSTPVQHAAPSLLAAGESVRGQIRKRSGTNLELLRTAVKGTPCHLLHAEGGWYATLQVPRTRTEEEWALDLLRKRSVLVQPGYFFDFESEAFLVLSLLTPEDVFREGVQRIVSEVER
ncbi:MAG: pyridoxal phosphate-dependent aminotransferase [Bryobacterales bacterium]|nr:pyridoxal phosphate-dependent aminotransferase [Bryobacterales bacterium]